MFFAVFLEEEYRFRVEVIAQVLARRLRLGFKRAMRL